MEAKWKAWRQVDKRTGRWVRCWREPGSRKRHVQFESRWIWEREHGPIPDSCVIHHMDGDQTNNGLDNLRLMTYEEHLDYHLRLRGVYKIIGGVEHKRCPKCDKYKPADCFYRKASGRLRSYCKECNTKYCKSYHAENRERAAARQRKCRARRRMQYAKGSKPS